MLRPLPILTILVCISSALGQGSWADCATITVGPETTYSVGSPMTFTASVSGSTPIVTPVYVWTISAGLIETGQGTPSISVDTTGLAGRTNITATR
jgi:hypothetical protein